jgi:hypothetical protein
MRCPSLLGLGLLLAVSASAQQRAELRARELFYTPITDAKPKAAEPKQAENKPVAKVTKPVTKPSGGTGSVQAGRKDSVDLPGGAKLQNASTDGDVVGPPLALKYRLLKLGDNGAYNEVDTDTIFRSGDKIRVSVESNDRAYLYIVQQGSSKTWNLLFPNQDTEQGSNRVERNREYEIPGGARFAFDEQPGTERLYLILSRSPEADLERLIYSLSNGSDTTQPASGERTSERPKMMIASTRIDDAFMGQFRQRNTTIARDLVFEKVNDDKPVSTSGGTRKEKALYVATPDRTAQARIVVDISLKHQ